MVKWQGCETVISGIRWMFMLSFLCPGVGSGANGCLGYLATSEPLKKPRCNRRFMSVRYKTQLSSFLGGALVQRQTA